MTSPVSWSRRLLPLALVAAIFAVAVSAALDWWGIERMKHLLASARGGDLALIPAVQDLHDDLLQLRRYEKDVLINVDSADMRETYRSKWDEAFLGLRYDLVRTRRLARESLDAPLQQFADAMAQYRSAFNETYGLIQHGEVRTTQQANDVLAHYKDSVHRAERTLVEIEGSALRSVGDVGEPVVGTQRLGLWVNLFLLTALGVGLLLSLRSSWSRLSAETGPSR